LAEIVLVVVEELGADPHVAELGHQQSEAAAREIKLTPTLALSFEQD